MLKDITIGQYYKEDSLIHRLDPRVKLFAVLIYVITLFMHKAPATYVMSLLFLIITIKISKVPVKYILRGLKAIAVILLFSVMINMLFIPGKPVIQFWIISISAEGIRTTIYLGSRLIMLVLGTSLLTFTTTPNPISKKPSEKFISPKIFNILQIFRKNLPTVSFSKTQRFFFSITFHH